MLHVMIDLETWGTKPGCDIRSIGAVVFDPLTGMLGNDPESYFARGDTFYAATENLRGIMRLPMRDEIPDKNGKVFVPIDDDECATYPLTRDPETVQWWNDQTDNAKAAFENPIDLKEACYNFGVWLGEINGEATNMSDSGLRIWANDPHFDVSIFQAVYEAVKLPLPWHYRAPRSVRTICDLAGFTKDDYCKFGEPHNALHDAIAQAMTVCKAYERLGLATE